MVIKNQKKPILVTGSHRSGSTWLGKMLSILPDVIYIHEPFNLQDNYKNKPNLRWFEFVSEYDQNYRQDEFRKYLDQFFNLEFNFTDLLYSMNTKGIRYIANVVKRHRSCKYLIKDPNAIFSAEWLAKEYNMNVIVIIRHPAAFVASLKVKQWFHDFNHFLSQEELMSHILPEFRNDMLKVLKSKPNIIEHGILLWNIIHSRIKSYQEDNKNWIFVKHEDLSTSPIEEFRSLYNKLDLPYNNQLINEILKHTNGSQISNLKRNSINNISTWKTRLTNSEIQRIKSKTKLISQCFYHYQDDW